MKLIIDVPEDTVGNIKNCGIFLNPRDEEILKKAFRNSQQLNDVFDKIRAEIEEQKEERCFDDEDMFAYKVGLDVAIEIIDKYKAESEEA